MNMISRLESRCIHVCTTNHDGYVAAFLCLLINDAFILILIIAQHIYKEPEAVEVLQTHRERYIREFRWTQKPIRVVV